MGRANERNVVDRITRYSALRAAERALRPSARLRREHATAYGLGLDLLKELQLLMDAAAAQGDVGTVQRGLPGIDAQLDRFEEVLDDLLTETPLAQFRATLPSITQTHRAEATVLLDFCIENPTRRERHLSLSDYMITLLSSETDGARRCLRLDPAAVSAGVARLAARLGRSLPDPAITTWRDAALEVVEADDVVAVVHRLRRVKADLGDRFFEAESLRAIVAYNLAVSNRLESLLDADRQRDRDIERTIRELRALDERPLPPMASPHGDAPGSAGSAGG